jgi:hypothetical protein
MIIDTYDLGNGFRAELLYFTRRNGEDDFCVSIRRYDDYILASHNSADNPLDAIFILMDLGLVHADYTLGETLQNHPLAPKKYWLP